MVLVMTVEPGFGGQQLHGGSARQKIRPPAAKWATVGHIQADGGVSLDNLPRLHSAGYPDRRRAWGTALYRSEHPKEDIEKIHRL